MSDDSAVMLAERYIHGHVVTVRPSGIIEVEVERPLRGISTFRVPPNHVPRDNTIRVGTQIRVFAYNIDAPPNKSQRVGFASIYWADKLNNPWEFGHPGHATVGLEVQGEIIAFAGTQNVIVLLDQHHLEGWLNIAALPPTAPLRPISTMPEFFSLGDRIRAEVVAVDALRCKLELSVARAYDRWKARCEQRKLESNINTAPPGFTAVPLPSDEHNAGISVYAPDTHAPSSAPVGAGATECPGQTPQPWLGRHVLVIEDDIEFGRNLAGWASAFGAEVSRVVNPAALKETLTGMTRPFTHVLCDYHLGGPDARKDTFRQLQHAFASDKEVLVAVMSAVPQEAYNGQRGRDASRPPDVIARAPVFAKPIAFDELDSWLRSGKPPLWTPEAEEAGQRMWRESERDSNITERATQALTGFCLNIHARGALWLNVINSHDLSDDDAHQEAGVALDIEPLAISGVQVPSDRRWRARLGFTLLRDVWKGHARLVQRVATSGALKECAPLGATWLAAWPVVDRTRERRTIHGMLIAFFDDSEISIDSSSKEFQVYLDKPKNATAAELTCARLDDLATTHALAERVREQDLFASLGRQASAVLHEIKSTAEVFETTSLEMARANLKSFYAAGRKLFKISKQGLFYVRENRAATAGLAETLQRLARDLLWLRVDRSGCTLQMLLPPQTLNVQIPLEPLDHALLNIIDNALYWSQGRPFARVTVRFEQRPALSQTPLVLVVKDEGLGIGIDAQRAMFSPRVTEKGRSGHGMGLYISRTLLRSIGGDLVCVTSDCYRFFGSCFEIRLPLYLGSEAALARRLSE